MNRQLRAVGTVSLLLISALVVGTTYWQVWAAPDLAEKQDNAIRSVAEYTIKRGRILAADGTVLARNRVVKTKEGRTFYFRNYPHGDLFPHVVGYSTQARSRTGLERSANDYLTGADKTIATQLRSLTEHAVGATVDGSDIRLSLDPKAQRVAIDALGNNCGAAVALEPDTGRVLAMASSPGYNLNGATTQSGFDRIKRIKADCPFPSPLLNRATQGLLIPGSAFKVVTAAAALESGKYNTDSRFSDPGYCIEYGQRVSNFADTGGNPEVFGSVNFVQALQHSINSIFCEIGKALGPRKVLDEAKKFGFYSPPPIELPGSELKASGLYKDGKLFDPSDESKVDPGRLAFGQEKMLVTPLQMAMVAGAVANDGILMQPRLIDRVIRPDGTVVRLKSHELGQPLKPGNAAQLAQMMEAVVTGGTGTAAQIPGIRVAGKTGTAENGTGQPNTTWFISFAPVDNPKVAVAVALQNQELTGGVTAAPIARQIMQALLSPNLRGQ